MRRLSTPLKNFERANGPASEWREFADTCALSEVVEATWEGLGGWAHAIRLLPDGCADIVWDGRRLSATRPRASAFRRQVVDRTFNVGLRLRCGQAGLVLAPNLDPNATDIDLRRLWGPLAASGETRLSGQRDAGRCREILLDLVGERLSGVVQGEGPPVAMIELLRTEVASVDLLASRQGWPARDLRRAFQRHVGFSPKALQRVFRFRRVLNSLAATSANAMTAAQLAADIGYADQAHMIRDCRAICGSTPGQLSRRLRTGAPESSSRGG